MSITSARFISKDEYRIEYVEDGVPKDIKGFDNPMRAKILAEVPIEKFVASPIQADLMYDRITGEFWTRAAHALGVHVDRARTDMLITGKVPYAVKELWSKATALMDGGHITPDELKDDSTWK